MEYEKESYVICLSDPKQSALYFGHIIPLSFIPYDMYDHFCKSGSKPGWHKDYEPNADVYFRLFSVEDSELHLSPADIGLISLYYLKYFSLLYDIINIIADESPDSPEKIEKLSRVVDIQDMLSSSQILELSKSIHKNVKRIGFTARASDFVELAAMIYLENLPIPNDENSFRSYVQRVSLILKGKPSRVLLPSSCLSYYDASENDLTVSIANMQLVDTNKAEWDQIIEFRRDPEARKKLRNLRLFLHANYEGKNQSFIEDDLSKRLEDYKAACKDWGFETIFSTLSMVLDSKRLLTAAGTSVGAAALFGNEITTAGAVATGVSIEIGKIVVELVKKRHAFNKLRRDHELAYIIEAKEKLQ